MYAMSGTNFRGNQAKVFVLIRTNFQGDLSDILMYAMTRMNSWAHQTDVDVYVSRRVDSSEVFFKIELFNFWIL